MFNKTQIFLSKLYIKMILPIEKCFWFISLARVKILHSKSKLIEHAILIRVKLHLRLLWSPLNHLILNVKNMLINN